MPRIRPISFYHSVPRAESLRLGRGPVLIVGLALEVSLDVTSRPQPPTRTARVLFSLKPFRSVSSVSGSIKHS
eukprot:4082337-Prymnesium_polylepis.1